MLAINPKYAGKGYASALLAHQIGEHFKAFPSKPVILDTSTEQGVRVYERLGFQLLEERPVATRTDSRGISPSKDKALALKEAKTVCVQRVMIKAPEKWDRHEFNLKSIA
jgi:ribosomal protein S18 acetylase RimI-like enzyme